MSCAWDTNKIIQQLVQGRELTNQLRDLLTHAHDSGLVGREEDLVIRICNTFSNTLSILRNCNTYNDYTQKPNNNMSMSMSCDGRKSQDSGESVKSTLKDRRGSYKRRKCVASRTSISSALINDGYAWRKYGQKQILNANHPRSYYRCTHKTEQGCQATKQVQKIQDDPPKYETIYSGHHTCKNTLKPCHFILDHSISNDSSLLISFAIERERDHPFLSSLEQESKENYKPISEITYNNGSGYLLSPHHHLSTLDPSPEMSALSADHDVISGVVDSVQDIDDFLEF